MDDKEKNLAFIVIVLLFILSWLIIAFLKLC